MIRSQIPINTTLTASLARDVKSVRHVTSSWAVRANKTLLTYTEPKNCKKGKKGSTLPNKILPPREHMSCYLTNRIIILPFRTHSLLRSEFLFAFIITGGEPNTTLYLFKINLTSAAAVALQKLAKRKLLREKQPA